MHPHDAFPPGIPQHPPTEPMPDFTTALEMQQDDSSSTHSANSTPFPVFVSSSESSEDNHPPSPPPPPPPTNSPRVRTVSFLADQTNPSLPVPPLHFRPLHARNPTLRNICRHRIQRPPHAAMRQDTRTYFPISIVPDKYTPRRPSYTCTPWIIDTRPTHSLRTGMWLAIDGWSLGVLGRIQHFERSSVIFTVANWGDDSERWLWHGLIAISIEWVHLNTLDAAVFNIFRTLRDDTTEETLRHLHPGRSRHTARPRTNEILGPYRSHDNPYPQNSEPDDL